MAVDWEELQKPVDTRDEYVLTTGEALALCSLEEIARLERKVEKRMALWNKQSGRCIMDDSVKSAPYDKRLIERERERRKKLMTVSFCGLVFYVESMKILYEGTYQRKSQIPKHLQNRAVHFPEETHENGGHRGANGEWVTTYKTTPGHWRISTRLYTLVRQSVWSLYGSSCMGRANLAEHKILLSEDELREMILRGAIWNEQEDPNAPWKILSEDAGDQE